MVGGTATMALQWLAKSSDRVPPPLLAVDNESRSSLESSRLCPRTRKPATWWLACTLVIPPFIFVVLVLAVQVTSDLV